MDTLTITGPVSVSLRAMSDDEFFEFCQRNDLRIERTAEGEIIVKPLVGFETGGRNSSIIAQLGVWAERDGRGQPYLHAGFTLLSGAMRSPDAAWISQERIQSIPEDEIERFAHVCPEFVIELVSPSDSVPELKRKMLDWIENGAQLAWLIDPFQRLVVEYTSGAVRTFDTPDEMAGTGPVEGFRLNLRKIWKGTII